MVTTKEKSPEAIKQELLASIMEIVDDNDYVELNNEEKMKSSQKRLYMSLNIRGASLIENRKIINIKGKQGELIKNFN